LTAFIVALDELKSFGVQQLPSLLSGVSGVTAKVPAM
jgi:hypothetical protein